MEWNVERNVEWNGTESDHLPRGLDGSYSLTQPNKIFDSTQSLLSNPCSTCMCS